MAILGMLSPWMIFYHELMSIFREDPTVRVIYDQDKSVIKLYVEGDEKAYALEQILPKEKTFGNAVPLKVDIIPANGTIVEPNFIEHEGLTDTIDIYKAAFKDNPALAYVHKVAGIFSQDLNYIVFKPIVVQYYNDSLGDVNGMCSTLYQDVAKDIFLPREGVFYCTDLVSDGIGLGQPLGEWP